jgi:hypothetical protein
MSQVKVSRCVVRGGGHSTIDRLTRGMEMRVLLDGEAAGPRQVVLEESGFRWVCSSSVDNDFLLAVMADHCEDCRHLVRRL